MFTVSNSRIYPSEVIHSHCRIHIMSGLVKEDSTREEQLQCYVKNLRYAAKELEKHNMIGLIEPINKYSVPNYFMNNYTDGNYVDLSNAESTCSFELQLQT